MVSVSFALVDAAFFKTLVQICVRIRTIVLRKRREGKIEG